MTTLQSLPARCRHGFPETIHHQPNFRQHEGRCMVSDGRVSRRVARDSIRTEASAVLERTTDVPGIKDFPRAAGMQDSLQSIVVAGMSYEHYCSFVIQVTSIAKGQHVAAQGHILLSYLPASRVTSMSSSTHKTWTRRCSASLLAVIRIVQSR
jgi:hypothetical protein